MTRRGGLAALSGLVLVAGTAVGALELGATTAGATAPTSGYALGFGNDGNGQVGAGSSNDITPRPTAAALPAGVTAVQVAAGYSHTVAVGTDGAVYAWGSNSDGELGNGTTTPSPTPVRVNLPAGVTVTSVAAGYLDSFAVTATGRVYAWGYGGQGEIGNGATADAHTPTAVSLPAGVSASAVSAGYAHALAVTTSGAVYAWGINTTGQLGDGTLTTRSTPVPVTFPTGTSITAVAAGFGHSLALTSTGVVYAWGANGKGQLGTGNTTGSAKPVKVTIGATAATSVAAGYAHSVATLTGGSSLAWGDNSTGQLGTGKSATDLPQANQPTAVALGGVKVVQAAAGFAHTVWRSEAGAVLSSGDNTYGELGTGDLNPSDAPGPVALPAGTAAIAAATSAYSLTTFVVLPPVDTTTTVTSSQADVPAGQPVTFTATVSPASGAGTVWFAAVGAALPGCQNLPLRRAPDGSYRATCSTATLPAGTTTITATYLPGQPYQASGGSLVGGQEVHAVAGAALAWGGNGSAQLGDGSSAARTAPVGVGLPAGSSVVQIAGGSNHALALLADGTVWAWGDNTYGELGDGSTTSHPKPVQVAVPAGVTPVSVAAGALTSAFVAADGSVYAWGYGAVGELGNGTTANQSAPTRVVLPAGTVATAASLGGAHLLVLTSTGAVYAAGGNTAGQLGDGTTAPRSTPVLVHLPGGVAVTGVSAGYAHSLAVTVDGTVLAWGANSTGGLGNGTTTSSPLPGAATLPAGTTVRAVAAGRDDSFALTDSGAVLSWGANDAGQLGVGSTAEADVPTAVKLPSGTNAVAIAAGASSAYALTDGGKVLGWGDGGTVGDGSTSTRTAPVAVAAPAAVHAVAIGAGATAGYAIAPPLPTQTAITSSLNPSTAGKPVTFTATVSGGDGGGAVAFTDGGTAIGGCGAVALTGAGPYTAKCTTSALDGGSHDVRAEYSGDAFYAASGAALDGGQQVTKIATTTKVTTSAAKVQRPKSVTFTATVSGTNGTGTVAFGSDGSTIAGCGAVALVKSSLGQWQAKCATTALTSGRHAIDAAYSGTGFYTASSATLSGGELVTEATKLVASPVVITDPHGGADYRATLTTSIDGTPLAGMTVKFQLNSLYGSSSCTAVTDTAGVAACTGARPKLNGGGYTAKFAGTEVYLASSGSSKVTF